MFPPSCLKDTRHSLVKNCSMVTRDRKEPPSETSRDLFFFQSLSHVCLFATPWTATHQASLSFTISWSLLKFMSIESVMPSNYLVLCCPLLLLPSIFPSIRVFSSEPAVHIRWPKAQNMAFTEPARNPCSEAESQAGCYCSVTESFFVTPWTAPRHASLSFTICWSLLKFMSIESVMFCKKHPLSPLSPPAFNLSQHQSLFQWVSSMYQVVKILELQLQHQSCQWIFKVDFL